MTQRALWMTAFTAVALAAVAPQASAAAPGADDRPGAASAECWWAGPLRCALNTAHRAYHAAERLVLCAANPYAACYLGDLEDLAGLR